MIIFNNFFHSQVLQGYVSSVEDHGYLISFDIEDIKAFLAKKDLSQGIIRSHVNLFIHDT